MGSGSASRRRSWRARSPWWRRFRFSTCWRGNSVAVRFPTLLPGLGLATVMIGVDQFLGSAAYGIFAIVPGVIAMAGQSVELVRAPHVKGVSTASLLLGTLNQTLWAIWAVQLQDSGSMIAILATSVLVVFNLTWYVLRRLGLRAFFSEPLSVVPGVAHAAKAQ